MWSLLGAKLMLHNGPGPFVRLLISPTIQSVYDGAAFRFNSKNASRRRSTLMW